MLKAPRRIEYGFPVAATMAMGVLPLDPTGLFDRL